MSSFTPSRVKRLNKMLDGSSLVFLGMMGCGKSAIGKMVATRLKLPFADSDAEIEVAAGRPVKDIFAEYGEEEFRRLEVKVIERLLEEGPKVLALGGGAFMRQETRDNINSAGLSIWLQADLDLLVTRVMRRPGKRPLLAKGNPREILSGLLAEREPVYSRARLHVPSTDGTKAETRNVVLEAIEAHMIAETSRKETAQ